MDPVLEYTAALEEIRQLKYRYLRDNLGPQIITVHRCGQPELTIEGDKATGTWSFEDTVIAMEHRVWIRGAAFYEDEYTRDSGGGGGSATPATGGSTRR